MKIAIVSDLHLGYERFFEDAYRQASEALGAAASLADVILIPGDIFDNRSPKPEVLAQGINLFRNLSEKEWKAKVASFEGSRKIYTSLPILAIPGTHERRAQGSENAVQLLSLAGLLVDISEATATIEKDGEAVSVYGLGGISEERVKEVLEKLKPVPSSGIFSIFMFHQSIYELMPFSNDFLTFNDLPKGFDLYIDGHIHSKVEESVFGKPLLIPGSTVLTQLKEGEQEPKGFFVFDTTTKKYTFHKINSRPFVFIKKDITGMGVEKIKNTLCDEIVKAIAKYAEKPIIKILLEGKIGNAKIENLDLQEIVKHFEAKAIIEITKSNLNESKLNEIGKGVRAGVLENISIHDYGMGLFLEKLRKENYSLNVNPATLFDALSSEASKDRAVKDALNLLFPD